MSIKEKIERNRIVYYGENADIFLKKLKLELKQQSNFHYLLS